MSKKGQKDGKKWLSKSEWVASLKREKTVDSDMADVTTSNDTKKGYPSFYNDGDSTSGRSDWKKKQYESKSTGSAFNDSEEEDMKALYDIIHNMVDRIMEQGKESASEGPAKKIRKIEIGNEDII